MPAKDPKAATSKAKPAAKARPVAKPKPKPKPSAREPGDVVLLSGGNPQIAKGDGDAPVQRYIAAMPGWKRAIGEQLDALITSAVPDVAKAVKWNSPFYGVAGQGWFLSFHCFNHYVKVSFFKGRALTPMPPGESKQEDVRYVDIHADDPIDAAQWTSWIQQASKIPGWGTS